MANAEGGRSSLPAERSTSLGYPVAQGQHGNIHTHNIRQTVYSAMKHTHKHTCTCVCMHVHATTIEEKNEFEREQGESAWEDLEDGKEWEEMV